MKKEREVVPKLLLLSLCWFRLLVIDASAAWAANTWAPTPCSCPSGRKGFSAVWTGSVMIVWGGHDGTGFLNTGGRYDPVMDTWQATSMTGAPSIRYAHTAIWTGSRMIVWGGSNGSTSLGDGGRYDPATDTWQATSTVRAPSMRANQTAVWTGSEMIVWGGWSGTSYLETGGRYTP